MQCNILSYNDYYPFGMLVPNRNYSSPSYRYGFQGQEKDDEIKGNGNSINYKFRMHDPRVGRFFAVDPLAGKYPWNSPYAFSENRVVDGVELEGLEFKIIHQQKNGWKNRYKSFIKLSYSDKVKFGWVEYGNRKVNGDYVGGFEDVNPKTMTLSTDGKNISEGIYGDNSSSLSFSNNILTTVFDDSQYKELVSTANSNINNKQTEYVFSKGNETIEGIKFEKTNEKSFSVTYKSFKIILDIEISAVNIKTDFINQTKELLESKGYSVTLTKVDVIEEGSGFISKINDPNNKGGVIVRSFIEIKYEKESKLIMSKTTISNKQLDIDVTKDNISGKVNVIRGENFKSNEIIIDDE